MEKSSKNEVVLMRKSSINIYKQGIFQPCSVLFVPHVLRHQEGTWAPSQMLALRSTSKRIRSTGSITWAIAIIAIIEVRALSMATVVAKSHQLIDGKHE